MALSETRAANPARIAKTKWLLPLSAAALLGAIALDTKVVTVGSDADLRQQAFNPDRFGTEQFPTVRTYVLEKAPEAATLAAAITADKKAAIAQYGTAAGVGAVMPVTVTGTLGAGRSGIFDLSVPGLPETLRVRVQTGPAINGTDLRDVTGTVEFGAFTNQIEYQDAGSGLNRAMAAAVLDGLDREALTGKTVTVTGAFTLLNPKMWLITPVAFEVLE